MTGLYHSDWELPVFNALSLMELPNSLISIGNFESSLLIYNYITKELI